MFFLAMEFSDLRSQLHFAIESFKLESTANDVQIVEFTTNSAKFCLPAIFLFKHFPHKN